MGQGEWRWPSVSLLRPATLTIRRGLRILQAAYFLKATVLRKHPFRIYDLFSDELGLAIYFEIPGSFPPQISSG